MTRFVHSPCSHETGLQVKDCRRFGVSVRMSDNAVTTFRAVRGVRNEKWAKK